MTRSEFQQLLAAHEAWLGSEQQGIGQLIVEGQRWANLDLAMRDVSNARLSGCELIDCHFQGCNFSNTAFLAARFTNCRFSKCKFVNADLRGLIANGCDFTGSNFTRADLTDAVLAANDLSNCVFDWSWLVRTDLRFATLAGLRLEYARLSGTKLHNDRQFAFVRPVKVTAQELDLSVEGDGSMLAGREGIDLLIMNKSE